MLALLVASCETTGDSGSPLEITEARWGEGSSGNEIVAEGRWVTGLSTPPRCALLRGSDREVVKSDSPASIEGSTFSKSFTPPGNGQESYHVKCSITLDPGRTVSDVQSVSGSPASA